MADDALDELYWVKPEEFTATRSRLAAAAKNRGDTDAANEISNSRKPTTAAWTVNRLALSRATTAQRLADLRERLRKAHSEMDGVRIRELSAEQRKLIDELARAAYDAAELNNPSAALQEDVTGTLQAAIADPDVNARLGRLTKAESWSGFGDFVVAEQAAPPERPKPPRTRDRVAAAEKAKADADELLSIRQAEVVAARRRHEEAERELKAAEAACEKARTASREAGERVKDAQKAN
ncbi:MAG TPA: hypothetical protein VH496_22130 [Mycobacterium sp.]|jgi:hypothetical protein